MPLTNGTVTQQAIVKINDLICPNKESNIQMLFPIPCKRNSECKVFGNGLICCHNKCVSGNKLQSKLQLQNSITTEKAQLNIQIRLNEPLKLMCPPTIQIQSQSPGLFTIACAYAKDCQFLGIDILCCQNKCAKGIADLKEASSSSTAVSARENNRILVCPSDKDFRPQILPIFSIPCQKNADCNFLGKDLLCCTKKCINGVAEIRNDIAHSPRFFGLVDTICPQVSIAEALDVKLCQSDLDCAGRICCLDKNGKNYCRTPAHRFDKIPGSKQFEQPIKNLVSFMQCTAPPPPLIDIFPKACRNNFDCFPNLCCQENGKKYCRPPKKSFLAAVVTRLGTSPVAKSFIARITT